MTLNINGIDFHWEEAGEGEPLLWLHGAMGSGADWRHMFKEPPAGYRLIAPDLRDHGASFTPAIEAGMSGIEPGMSGTQPGRSSGPSGAFTFRQCALDVRALLSHLGIPRIKAIGVSGGGIVLLHMATAEPSCLESMVVVSAPSAFPPQARAIMKQFSESMLNAAELDAMRARHKHGEAQVRQLFAMARGFADSYEDVNFTPEVLSTITAETLIVFGDRDPFYPVSIAVDMQRAIPRSYLWVVPNGGHGPVFAADAPRFVETALEFLAGNWRR